MRNFLLITTVLAGGLSLQAQSELRAAANSLAQDISSSGKRVIAVVDFTDLQGNPTELGRYLAEEFAVALTRTRKGFEVVDRTHLKALLTENKLASTGLIDPSTAKKLGQIAGVDALVTGSMTPFSESVRVAIKVLATDTARILAADNVDLPKTSTIAELLSAEIKPPTTSPPGAGPSPGRGRGASTPGRSPSSPVIVAAEVIFELLECKGLGDTVSCSFRLTNRGQDRELRIFCNESFGGSANDSRAFDNFGNEASGATCTISNKRSGENAQLISGVPVLASFVFKGLSTSASTLSLISIVAEVNGRDARPSIRNAPIVR